MKRRYCRDDVETHGLRYGHQRPAVNVKVYKGARDVKLPMHLGSSRPADAPEGTPFTDHYTDPRFTHAWIEEHITDEQLDAYFWSACEQGWECINDDLGNAFPHRSLKVYPEGRSGGWAVVEGLPPLETWDAIMLGRWHRFAKWARQAADGVPWSMLDSIYVNVFEPWAEDEDAKAERAREDAAKALLAEGVN